MEQTSVPLLIEAISRAFPEEVSIAVADDSRFIYYHPSQKIDLKIKPGDVIPEGTATHRALQIRQKVSLHVKSQIYGVPYFGLSIPLLSGGSAAGCVTAIFPQTAAEERARLPKHQFLIGKREDRWFPIPYQQICFIQSDGGKTSLYTEQDVYLNKYNLAELQNILPQDQFVRCHRSYFVNVNAIGEIHPHFHSTFILVMKDKHRSRIPVSQTYASSFRQLLGF
ncbi:LytTR family DNA-binding domain-containing protein [Brevibacillus massiliensis]|jgi:hypothetical protein|uniref:LytTR family DNA-binding domain-containing protein n=1 Tax=Brevibacillus massiliensis TaxID=1118054 RepID=UPI00031F7ED6|nr:LytTR family DNA-binding domain-containing protein [Brevibacillus massiliensis]